MQQEDIIIKNPAGLHTRPATLLTKQARKFRSEIILAKGEASADGKSLVKLLKLGISQGDKVMIRVTGEDEALAFTSMVRFIEELKD